MFMLFSTAFAEETAETAEAVEKTSPAWSQELFSKFAEMPSTAWIALGVLIAFGIILLVVTKTSRQWNARTLAFGALSIALSFILSCIRLYRMPQGGSVTPGSMLPIMLFSASFGVGPGLLTGLTYGILQYLQGGWFLNIWQFSLDYLLAFAALGLAGIAKNLPKGWGLYVAMVIAAVCRALSATLAGIMFWETAPWASLVYNGTYLIPEVIICILLSVPLAKPVMRIMKKR